MQFNQEVEQALLGAILANDTAFDHAEHLRPEYFSVPVHGRIFDHVKKLKAAGKGATPHAVATYFANDVDLSEAGGAAYIHDLAREIISTATTKAHADLIYTQHCRRAIAKLGVDLKELAENPTIEETPKALLNRADKLVQDASAFGDDSTIRHISDCTARTMKAMEKPQTGIRTGIAALDAIMRGFMPGELYLIAGRPSMGKSALGLTLALNASQAGHKALFFSLEMPQEQLTQRLLSRLSGECVHGGEAYSAEKVRAAAEKLNTLPLHIDDKSYLAVTDIAMRARRHKRQHGLDILFIDYLGLIAIEDKRANKVHQIEEITTSLKRLSKDLGIPVILLSQLSRALESRDNKRPLLSDLRDSGAIEQDADMVMFIHREEYYLDRDRPETTTPKFKGKNSEASQLADIDALRGKAEIIIAKSRQSRIATAHVLFNGKGQVFHD